jgi:hypothetical protein
MLTNANSVNSFFIFSFILVSNLAVSKDTQIRRKYCSAWYFSATFLSLWHYIYASVRHNVFMVCQYFFFCELAKLLKAQYEKPKITKTAKYEYQHTNYQGAGAVAGVYGSGA